jgi:hypothetical protein
MLQDRLESTQVGAAPLKYYRFIQRPAELYDSIRKREYERHTHSLAVVDVEPSGAVPVGESA